MSGLHLRAISHAFGNRRVLNDVSVSVDAGELVCLLGPSGCGKTTLLNILAGLDRADRGTIRIESPEGRDPVVRTVFQESRLLPWMTVHDNLAFVLDGPRHEKDALIREWLARVGLEGAGDRYPSQLSIGMQQRVAVARGLILRPDVLFMDEPFSSLDELTAMTVREELLDLWQEIGCTVVFVTHNPLEATLLADRIAVMSPGPGRITYEEDVSEDLPRPRDPDAPEMWRASRAVVARLRGDVPR